MASRLRIFTWHIHGSYLFYLAQGNYDIYLPVDPSKGDGFGGKGSFPFGPNVHEVPAQHVRELAFDCILFQSSKNYLIDQHVLFSLEQHRIPKIYLEHDPPRNTPTDTCHIVEDPDITLVHVTHFNQLMWNNNSTPSVVIEHGVISPAAAYKGTLEKGIVVVNNIRKRGRRLGYDIFLEVKKHIPLDLVGMGSAEAGGLGEVPLPQLPEFVSQYRFFFNPIRYTSLGLSVCEAMMLGMPIVGLATTEMPNVIRNGESGFISSNIQELIPVMRNLLEDQDLAARLGAGAQQVAKQRFNIQRFCKDWEELFHRVVAQRQALGTTVASLVK
jgi:glycosyltransferase involved in cell wall biosynthesis